MVVQVAVAGEAMILRAISCIFFLLSSIVVYYLCSIFVYCLPTLLMHPTLCGFGTCVYHLYTNGPASNVLPPRRAPEILILPFAFDVAMQSVVQRSCYLRYLLFQSQETRGANGIKNESFAPCIPQFFLPEVLGFKIKEVRLSLKESVQQRLASIPQG